MSIGLFAGRKKRSFSSVKCGDGFLLSCQIVAGYSRCRWTSKHNFFKWTFNSFFLDFRRLFFHFLIIFAAFFFLIFLHRFRDSELLSFGLSVFVCFVETVGLSSSLSFWIYVAAIDEGKHTQLQWEKERQRRMVDHEDRVSLSLFLPLSLFFFFYVSTASGTVENFAREKLEHEISQSRRNSTSRRRFRRLRCPAKEISSNRRTRIQIHFLSQKPFKRKCRHVSFSLRSNFCNMTKKKWSITFFMWSSKFFNSSYSGRKKISIWFIPSYFLRVPQHEKRKVSCSQLRQKSWRILVWNYSHSSPAFYVPID